MYWLLICERGFEVDLQATAALVAITWNAVCVNGCLVLLLIEVISKYIVCRIAAIVRV
jgi:hypothetical protein